MALGHTLDAMALQNLAKSDTLADRVATEILKALAARRQSQAALAREMEVPAMWVSDRLSGKTQITINDLERIATTLGVKVPELLSGAVTDTYPALPRKLPPRAGYGRASTRPGDRRPSGRPDTVTGPAGHAPEKNGAARTSRVDRPAA